MLKKTENQSSNVYNPSKYLRRHWKDFFKQLKSTKSVISLLKPHRIQKVQFCTVKTKLITLNSFNILATEFIAYTCIL